MEGSWSATDGAKVIDKFYQDCRQWKRATNAGSQDAMTNYLLVSFKTCPWVQRAAIVLREKKVDFEFRHIEPDNRPDWFLAISPHKKVPVLRIDDKVSLFESNAIAEYLDETIAPRLHPADPAERAVNRAWTDYIPTFAQSVTGCAYADTEADFNKAIGQIPAAFERLETALTKQGGGPFFNGTAYALVDAGYAPFLQRYFFLDRIRKLGQIEKFPRLKAWADALMARPSTHSFPPAEFEAMYRQNVKRRNKWLSQFVDAAAVAAE
jgi:glutathione S-transferase